jgi:hypothetical protein
MNFEYASKCEKQMGRKFGYVIRCDDRNKPDEVLTDMYFELWQYEELYRILEICEKHQLKYDFALQCFNAEIDYIEQEICFLSKNCEN